MADSQSRAILAQFEQSGALLEEWRDTTRATYAGHPDLDALLDQIPQVKELSITKLLGGMIETDTCNTARFTRRKICDAIIALGRLEGLQDDQFFF